MSGYAGYAEVILRGAAARSVLLRRAGQFLLASQLDRLAAECANELAYLGGARNLGDLMARCSNLPGGKPSSAPLSAYSAAELRKYRTAGAAVGLTRQETDQVIRESIRTNETAPPAKAYRPPGGKGDKP